MSFRQRLVQQFKQPSGILGRLAGFIMSTRGSNVARNAWLIDLLRFEPDDVVLEIGFGPGVAIENALRIITHGKIYGIDHSDVMLKQASRRNTQAIRDGRLKLFQASVDSLSRFDTQFDHVFSANVVQFWDEPEKIFRELKPLLKPKGQLSTLFMPRNQNATSADAHAMAKQLESWLESAGYRNIRTEVREFDGLDTICVIAHEG